MVVFRSKILFIMAIFDYVILTKSLFSREQMIFKLSK